MKTTLIIITTLITLATQGADWTMGSPDGSWSMGTSDASYPMDSDNKQAADDRATREYQIAHHEITLGFTYDEVLRAWGKPYDISRALSENGATELWRYESPHAFVYFSNGIVTRISD
jgi:hypothetical protein